MSIHPDEHSRLALFTLACCLLLTAVLPAAAQQETAEVQDSRLVEEIEVRRIQVPLLATDERGNPIDDLRPDELTVTVDRKPARVAGLDSARVAPLPLDERPEVRLRLEGGEAEALDPGLGGETRAAVIFIDADMPVAFAMNDGHEKITRFVDELLEGVNMAAVFSYGREFRLESSFTGNKPRVREAVESAFDNRSPRRQLLQIRIRRLVKDLELCVEEGETESLALGGEPALMSTEIFRPEVACLQLYANSFGTEERIRGERLMRAVAEVVRYARGIDGTVTVYAITHGASLEPQRIFWEAVRAVFGDTPENDELRARMPDDVSDRVLAEVLKLAENERVSLNFVDPTSEPAGVISAGLRGIYRELARPVEIAYASAQDPSRQLARETAGVFVHESDLLEGLRSAARMENGRYYLTVEPAETIDRDRSTRIRVRCSRPGVDITYARSRDLRAERAGSFETRIALPLSRLSTTEDALVSVPFSVGLRARDLHYEKISGESVAEMTVHLRVESMSGEPLAQSYHHVHHVAEGDEQAVGVVTLRGALEAQPGSYRIVAHVRSLSSERRSTSIRDVVVPAPPERRAEGA